MKIPSLRTSWFFCLIVFGLSGCGFKLRGSQPLPEGIEQVYLSGTQSNSPLKRAVQNSLKIHQIAYTSEQPQSNQQQTIAVYLMPDSLDRRLLSLFQTGQVAEYELVLSIRFQVAFAGQEPQFIEFDITREYQDDPDAILAKSRELDLVLRELRQQAADRIIRMLPSLKSNAL